MLDIKIHQVLPFFLQNTCLSKQVKIIFSFFKFGTLCFQRTTLKLDALQNVQTTEYLKTPHSFISLSLLLNIIIIIFKKLIAATCIMKYCTRPQYKCTLTRRMSQSQFVVRLVGRVSGWVLRPRLTPKVRSHRFFFRPQTGARSFTWLSLLILSSSRGSGSSLDGRAVFQTGFLFNRLCLT